MRRAGSPPDRYDWLIAFVVAAGTFALLLATTQMGFTRDESFYFHAAREYIGWFHALSDAWSAGDLAHAFSREVVDAHWSYNKEHPALMKTLFALSHELFHVKLGWLGVGDAMRLPTIAMSAALYGMTYLFGAQLFGRTAGLVGAGALLLQPRFFFHAHMACFDAPMAAVWFAVMYAYWRGLESRRWAWACGALWGLALATKLNAFFIPILLVLHWSVSKGWGTVVHRRDGVWTATMPQVPWFLVSMAILGPAIFFAHWPRIWFDTFERVSWYMAFHLNHVHYHVYYLGENLQYPPFPRSLPFVMTAVTVPATVLAAGAIGAWAWVRERTRLGAMLGDSSEGATERDGRATGLFLLVNILFPIVLISGPETPIFGGTKHWMSAMPYLSMLAGFGVVWSARRLSEGVEGRALAASAALALACLLPAGVELANNHPYGTSYYNEVIGSHRGAAEARMMRQFWGYTSRQALPWLEEHAPERARVWTHNTTGWAWSDYAKDGVRTRGDLRSSGIPGARYGLYHHQKAFRYLRAEAFRAHGFDAPVHVVDVDGVTLLSIHDFGD